MPATTPLPSGPDRAAARRATRGVVRPLEQAERVWERAVELAGAGAGVEHDRFAVALDLLRTAQHGPSTMLHALTLGRAHHRDHPADPDVREAVRLLERATTWLGSPATPSDVGRPG
jgi:hypothetical protein